MQLKKHVEDFRTKVQKHPRPLTKQKTKKPYISKGKLFDNDYQRAKAT